VYHAGLTCQPGLFVAWSSTSLDPKLEQSSIMRALKRDPSSHASVDPVTSCSTLGASSVVHDAPPRHIERKEGGGKEALKRVGRGAGIRLSSHPRTAVPRLQSSMGHQPHLKHSSRVRHVQEASPAEGWEASPTLSSHPSLKFARPDRGPYGSKAPWGISHISNTAREYVMYKRRVQTRPGRGAPA
jgi:hypothetical protein